MLIRAKPPSPWPWSISSAWVVTFLLNRVIFLMDFERSRLTVQKLNCKLRNLVFSGGGLNARSAPCLLSAQPFGVLVM